MSYIDPYRGNENYIFISYAHKDSETVLPILQRLKSDGYRFWYDDGIDPGTEWDTTIADHIYNCGYFLAFMSNSYINSSNCNDELSYARDLEKKRLIIYLEDVELPRGLAMRINRIQSVFKHKYSDDEAFFKALYYAEDIKEFAGDGAPDTPLQGVRKKEVLQLEYGTYEGETENGDPHGIGKLTFTNDSFKGCSKGDVYEGEFKDGKPHGKGKLTTDLFGGRVVEGRFINGEPDNDYEGKITLVKSGTVYNGSLSNMCWYFLHGIGTFTCPNGNVYKGTIRRNALFNGKLFYPNGDVYEGKCVYFVPSGGKLTYANGDVYEGEFKDGKPHGKGDLTCANGNTLHGNFQNGKPHGKCCGLQDGNAVESEYENGQLKHQKILMHKGFLD